jgi:hypothetical protein
MTNWVQMQQTYKDLERDGKAIFITLEGQEYFVWSITAEDEEVWLLPTNETCWGSFEIEMICNDFALYFPEDHIDAIENAFQDPRCQINASYAQIDWDDDEDRMVIHKDGDPLPPNATGRFLRYNQENGAFEFVK